MSVLGPRSAGVLCPIGALPGDHGIGDLDAAQGFLEFLEQAEQRVWQILPVHVTSRAAGNSPYSALSAFALDPLLLGADGLVSSGWILPDDVGEPLVEGAADFENARARRRGWIDAALRRLKDGRVPDDAVARFEAYVDEPTGWVGEFAEFAALRRHHHGLPWTAWPAPLRDREPDALDAMRTAHAVEIERAVLTQHLLLRQWQALRRAATERNVRLFGDLPMYVAHDSADVWCHRDLFALDEDGRPRLQAGVPPDLFSETGQLWSLPLYDWERMAEDGFAWFSRRVSHERTLVDLLRIDHFRAVSAYYAIPGDAETAQDGTWHDGPGAALLDAVLEAVPEPALVAEDLGQIDAPVYDLMERFGLPGMRVLQFGFQDEFPDSRHLPHRYVEDCVAYTGTHDNDTARGWFEDELDPDARARVRDYAGVGADADIADAMIRMVMRSVARLAIVPLQDVLGLGGDARINRPGAPDGNWRWRVGGSALTATAAERLAACTRTFGRAASREG